MKLFFVVPLLTKILGKEIENLKPTLKTDFSLKTRP